MKRISVQLSSEALQLLKRRADQKGISVSQLVNDFIVQGLNADNKVDRYLLKSVFETLLIVRTLADTQVLTDANQRARELATQAMEDIS